MENLKNNKTEIEEVVVKTEGGTPFDGMLDVTILSYTEIAQLVNKLFVNIFSDYNGCKPIVNNNQVTVLLQFVPNRGTGSKDKIAACESIRNISKGESHIERFLMMSNMNSVPGEEQFVLTKTAKDILKKYFREPSSLNWSMLTYQDFARGMHRSDMIEFNLKDLDLNLILEDVFEKKGNDYSYNVTLLDNVYGYGMNDLLFKIERADDTVTKKIYSKYYNIPMATTGGTDVIIANR